MRLTRRQVLSGLGGLGGLGAAALVGCGGGRKPARTVGPDAATARGPQPQPPPAGDHGGYIRGYEPSLAEPPPGEPTTAPTAACVETEDNIEGPYFKPGSPVQPIIVSAAEAKRRKAQRLILTGKVMDVRCQPLAGAVFDLWHADEKGGYDMTTFVHRGRVTSDANGVYRFETIIPGRYLNGPQYRPAHLHAKIGARDHGLLTTQLYFPDDPYNDVDPFIRRSLIMPLQNSGDTRVANFDVVLG